MWPLSYKNGSPECQKNPRIPNILTNNCSGKGKLTHRQSLYRLEPAELSVAVWLILIMFISPVSIILYWRSTVGTKQIKYTAIDSGWVLIFYYFFPFLFRFFLAVQKYECSCLYHFAPYMPIYHSITVVLDVVIFGDRVFLNFLIFPYLLSPALTSDASIAMSIHEHKNKHKHKGSLCASEDGHDISISIRVRIN